MSASELLRGGRGRNGPHRPVEASAACLTLHVLGDELRVNLLAICSRGSLHV